MPRSLHQHRAWVRCAWVGLWLGGIAQAQLIDRSSQPPRSYPARIFTIEAINETDARVGFFLESGGTYRVLGRADLDAEPQVMGTGTVAKAGIYYWTDVDVLKAVGRRYYHLRVTLGGKREGQSDQWALYVQEREPQQRYLVSLPVDPGPDSTLAGPLGKQLMYGLGAGTSTNEADALRVMDELGVWQSAYLVASKGEAPQWREADMATPSALAIQRGAAFWVLRKSAPAWVTSKAILAGQVPAQAKARRFGLAKGGITPFGNSLQTTLRHHSAAAEGTPSVAVNALGFSVLGSAGTTDDMHRADERGDEIWVWRNNAWSGKYWLMGHLDASRNGRWWDSRKNDFAEFALEPGFGYYYIHRTNRWGGSAFNWTPPAP